jgi:spoIIIJ-associated protein
MYDARQEPNEFVADSLNAARAKAAEFFGIEESELKVIVPKDGEIYGVHGQTVITALPKSSVGKTHQSGGGESRDQESRGDSRGPRKKEGRGGRPERGGRNDRAEAQGRDDNSRSARPERGGRERGGRPERASQSETRGDSQPESLEPEVKPAVADSKGKASGKLGPIGEFLLGAVERMKLGSFELSESSEGDYLIFQLSGAAAEALQGGDGRATDALQLVANQVAMRQSEDAPRIVVDVEGGGDEREQTLTRLADRAVKRARDTSRSIALDPMNSRDRRTIHVTIRDVDGVETMSIGEGRYRQVLVVPEGAPEYDDAVAESS